jgi:hypothetical protein
VPFGEITIRRACEVARLVQDRACWHVWPKAGGHSADSRGHLRQGGARSSWLKIGHHAHLLNFFGQVIKQMIFKV